MSNKNSQRLTAWWIFFAFGAWIFAFLGFLTSRFELTSDAVSYYDHTKFFIENIGRGVYPLWDPFWYYGVSNDLFLRRIGAFNPFYLIILFFKSIGIPYTLSYLWSLGGYYYSGMIAFYLLAMRIYHDRFIAYAGYLILLFSALGTRLFDSYMMLVTVPLIWFFYFLVAFTQTPRKHFFLGMSLSFMILAGTYIPFYFLIVLGFSLFFFFLVYFNQIPKIFCAWVGFFKENKILVVLSLLVLILSFLPIIAFFHDSSHGQVVLPLRHSNASLENTLTVAHRALDWGAVEDLMYSSFFSDLRQYKFAVIYVPFFSIIVLALGLIGQIRRRAVFIFLLGTALFCSIIPHGLPFYDFFYQHIFFLKYFRNLHFFIWFFLIPLFVLLVLEHWKMFTEMKETHPRHRWLLLAYVLGVHVMAFLFVWWRSDAVPSTYIMIFLSLVFWSCLTLGKLKGNAWGFLLLTLTVLIQPLEAYHYFSLKAIAHLHPYDYDSPHTSLKIKDPDLFKPENIPLGKEPLYYISGGYNFLYQNINNQALAQYLQNKFILVDRLEAVDSKSINTAVLEHNFLTNDNTAIVFKQPGVDMKLIERSPQAGPKAQPIDENSQGFKLLAFDANHVRLALDVPYEKFLVYNDSYDPKWQVSINHHPARLYEVNGAFKGTWIPSGKSVVEFSYGSWWQYTISILLSIFAFIFLAGTIGYACKEQDT